jgi:hypothetical protein
VWHRIHLGWRSPLGPATVKIALRLKPDGYLVKPVLPKNLAALLGTMFDLP